MSILAPLVGAKFFEVRVIRTTVLSILLIASCAASAAMEKSDLALHVVESAVLRDSMNQMLLAVDKSEQRMPVLRYSYNPLYFLQGWQVFEFYGQVTPRRSSSFPIKGRAMVSFTPIFTDGKNCTFALVQKLQLDRLSPGSDGSAEKGLVISTFHIQQTAGFLDCE